MTTIPPPVTPATAAPAHILVVEDSATQALSLALLLEEAGYRTTVARTGEQALALLPSDVALVLSDIVMPGMDGYTLCRRITDASWGARLPVVLLTSLSDPLAIVRGLESGASHFVTKPYEAERLLARVQRALDAPDDAMRRESPVRVTASGGTFSIAASRARIVDLLLSGYEDLARTSEAERAGEQRARFLADAGERLATSLDQRAVLRELARLAVPRLGDTCLVDLVGEDGQVHPVAANEGAEAPEPASPWLDAGGAPVEGGGVLVAADPLDAAPRLRDVLAFPLVARGARMGVLAVGRAPGTPAWTRHDIELATDLARRAAAAVDNARLYEAAQRATRSRDDMLAIVSHDLRNPVSTIGLSAQLMLEMHASGAPIRLEQQLGVIRRSADRANALINDLLDVSRIESATLSVDQQPVDARVLLSDLADEFASLARGGGLSLASAWQGDGAAWVLADRQRIGQVLANLVGNAVKFTTRDGAVTIAGTAHDGRARFTVRDSGVGIPAEHLPFLFDRFWQAHEHRRAGAGLGLFIARGIVEAHGGRLEVESTQGTGTTFAFTLPLAAPDQVPPPVAGTNAPTAG